MSRQWMGRMMATLLTVCAIGARGQTAVPQFNGSNAYARATYFNAKHGTLEMWFSPRDNAGTGQWTNRFDLVCGQLTGSGRVMLYRENSTTLRWFYENSGQAAQTVDINATGWQGGAFYHLAIQFSDGDNSAITRVFTNGVEVGSKVVWGTVPAQNQLNLMRYVTGINFAAGRLADVRLWNTLRTGFEIQDHRQRRLLGNEAGLVAYWPMAEGSGTAALDGSGNNRTAGLTNVVWTTTSDITFEEPSDAGYLRLADIDTGNRLYSNSNEVSVVAFIAPDGYDQYQINEITDAGSLNAGAWISTNTAPTTATFAVPSPEGLVTLRAWFRDSSDTLPVTNTTATITYVRDSANVTAAARATLSRPSWGTAWPAVIKVADIENGSTSSIGIYGRAISAPEDQTPADPSVVTLVDPGNYMVTLTVTDAAGNTDTATTAVTITAGPVPQTTAWTGAGNNDWFNHANWSNFSPGPGAVATIASGNVVLSTNTAPMASFTLSGGTLTFNNWETTLTATDVAINGGTLIHPLQSAMQTVGGVWIPDHRVRIAASNFVLKTTVNLSARGFQNSQSYNLRGKGPGGSSAGGGGSGGAGYGGRGGDDGTGYGGVAYGTAGTPELWPGSGAGNRDQHGGGHGGGLFVLNAAGHVILNGTINVNGGDTANFWGGGGGSGGGISIRAATLAATNAVLTANGGNGGGFTSGSGGGGRIAVAISDSGAQNALPIPNISMRTQYGQSSGPQATPNTRLGDYGTVWVNHDSLLPAVMTNSYGYFHGTIVTNVARPSLALTNCWIRLAGNESFAVAGDVSLSGSALFELRETAIGGDVTLTNGSTLSFYGISTNGLPDALTTPVTVGGTLSVASNCAVYVYSDPVTGGSPFFEVGSIYLAPFAVINADQKGFGGGTLRGYGPGAVTNIGATAYGGASHGGLGGRNPTYGGTVYGSAAHPAMPGSGASGSGIGRTGGGLIHITADSMALHGTVTANGGAAVANIGASSGGGIYLWADVFDPAAGVLRAEGGAGSGTGTTAYGGGGGGRIARLYRVDGFAGTTSVAGGAGTYAGQTGSTYSDYYATFTTITVEGNPARRGVPSPNYGANGVISGTVVTNRVDLRVDEANGVRYRCIGWQVTDASGFSDAGSGTEVIVTVTTNTTLTWLWTNEYYLVASAGPGGSLQTDRTGWYTDGEATSLTPVPSGGYAFSQWSGGYAPASLNASPLPITMNQPRAIRANFGMVAGQVKDWVGGTGNWMDTALWSPAGIPGFADTVLIGSGAVTLSEASIAVAKLTVTNAATLTAADVPFAVTGDLVVSGATARVTMTRGDLAVGGDLALLAGGDLYVTSAMTSSERPEYGTRAQVAGCLVIASNSWVYPQSHNTNGGSVFFQIGKNLLVASGGGFDANARGYKGGLSELDGGGVYTVGWGPGRGYYGYGAGYGGRGGSAAAPYGQTYGYAERPIQPGSGGGGNTGGAQNRRGGAGGGLVWIEAKGVIRLDGTLTAVGENGQGDYFTGGGSGGGIHLRCRRFEGTGALSANGGGGNFYQSPPSGTAGGGGRIAVWRVSHQYTGTATVNVGVPVGTNPEVEAGTIHWGDLPADGTILIFR